MTFEEALQRASTEYLEQRKNLSTADVERLFGEHFHVFDVLENEGQHTISLPGPKLWQRRWGDENSPYWLCNNDNDAKKLAKLANYHMRWPEGSGKDGIINLSFEKRQGFNYVNVQFNTYLVIPNNSLEHQGLVVPIGESAESVKDLVWVYNTNGLRTDEELTNWSKYGKIRHIWTEGFARFSRFLGREEDPNNFAELIIHLPGNSTNVAYILPRVFRDGERDDEFMKRSYGVALGDGSVDAFFKHMQYDEEINSILKS